MPRKKVKSSSKAIPLGEAAKVVGASTTAVGNWVRQDKELRSMVRRGARGARLFSEEAVARLKKIRDDRFAAAGPGLRKAWAARKRKGGGGKLARAKSGAAAQPRAVAGPTPAGISGAKAAKDLGIAKPRLYEILKRAGIKKPAARNAFTPAILEQVREALRKRAPKAAPASPRRPSSARRRGKEPHGATVAGAAGDLTATVASMIEKAVGSAQEQARTLARRALEEARDALDRGLKALG